MPSDIQHICIADDDEDDYYLFEAAFKEADGLVRLSHFKTCAALLTWLQSGDALPELIIMDVNMPGNDNYSCLLAIKKEAHLAHIPVIIYSTSGTPALVKKAHECGAYKYLIKPSSMGLIREMVKDLLATPVQEQRKTI